MTALRTGDRVSAYEIVGLLGHGAMGEVYRARDTRLGREVAVKVLPVAFATDPDRLARLEREARLISQVNHPNICTLYDIVESESAPFLIFELVEGETLQQRLLRGPMPVSDALRYASGIAAALQAAHSKGIVHRDLKPSNIKTTAGGDIKVLDFGVAKLARGSDFEPDGPDLTITLGGTKEGALVGTVAYVSPEQAMGDHVDARSDIWAFGCLLVRNVDGQACVSRCGGGRYARRRHARRTRLGGIARRNAIRGSDAAAPMPRKRSRTAAGEHRRRTSRNR